MPEARLGDKVGDWERWRPDPFSPSPFEVSGLSPGSGAGEGGTAGLLGVSASRKEGREAILPRPLETHRHCSSPGNPEPPGKGLPASASARPGKKHSTKVPDASSERDGPTEGVSLSSQSLAVILKILTV